MQNNRLERKETAFRLFSLTRCKRSVSDRAARLDAQARTRNRRFFDFEKTKKNQKGKKRKK